MATFNNFEDRVAAEETFCQKHGIQVIDGTETSSANWKDVISALESTPAAVITFLGNDHGNPWFALSSEKLTKDVAEELYDLSNSVE